MSPRSICLAFALLALSACAAAPALPPEAPSRSVADAAAANGAGLGGAVYARACAACHDAAVGQAPLRSALAALPAERILASLTTGVMQVQGSILTGEEKSAVADFLGADPAAPALAGGVCPPEERGVMTPVRVADWGVTPANTRAVDAAATAVNAGNAHTLALDWVFAFPSGTRARVQPTLAGDTLFTADQNGVVYALSAATGCTRWTVPTGAEIRSALVIGTDAEGRPNRLYFGDFSGGVHALDLKSLTKLWSVRPDDHAAATITGTLRLHDGRLFVPISSTEVVSAMTDAYACCTFRGAVAALDAATGEIVWKTYTISEAPTRQGVNRAGADRFGPSGAPVWGSPTIDAARGVLYVGTGENYSQPATDTSDAILALSLEDGSVRWRFQALPEDVWNAACSRGANCPENTGPDYDFGAPPLLARTPGGRELLYAGQKSGYVYALDPDAGGRLVWKSKPGRGGIMGGVHWGMTADQLALYAPVSDISVYPWDAHLPAQSGLHALDLSTGAKLWSTVLENQCGETAWRCSPGLSAAATLAPGVVFGGGLDGRMHAFAAQDGRVLWSFDTNRDFASVNGEPAAGGSIDSAGPVLAGDRLYTTSGYDKFGQKAGNVLLAFRLKP